MDDATRHAHPGIPAKRGAEWVPRRFWQAPVPLNEVLAAGTAVGADVPVFVNEGRWVVACPDCGGAQLACRTDRRFMCNECGNATVGGLWRRVVWPRDIDGIEQALAARRLNVNRNWLPGETAGDLVTETLLHEGI